MNISGLHQKNDYNPISFQKDKYFLYADFDRTLSPVTTSDIFFATDKDKIDSAKKSSSQMQELLKKSKDKLSLIITTGRALVEMKVMQNLYRNQNIEIPRADSIIVKNGSEEFIPNKDDYLLSKSNDVRTKEITSKTNWSNDRFNNIAQDILKEYNLEPVYTQTTLSAQKYSPYSIFSDSEKLKDNNVIFRDIGKAKVFYGFSNNVDDNIVASFREIFEQKLDGLGVEFKVQEKFDDKECNSFHTLTYSPVIDNYSLEKDYDVRMAVKKAKIEEDTVIAAGDSYNDFTMLNPITYLEHFPQNEDRNNLDRALSIVNNDETLKQELKDLPLISIISVKDDEKEEDLEKLNKYFGQSSEYKKVVTTKEGNLAQKVSEIMNSGKVAFKGRSKCYISEFDFSSKLDKVSFLEDEHKEFIYDFLKNSKKVSSYVVLNTLKKLDETYLEAQFKRNLSEHMITKAEQDKERNLDELISSIKFFSQNKDFSDRLISDTSKYLIENPDVERGKYYNILSEVNKNMKEKEVLPNIVKTSKLLYSKDYLNEYFVKGCSYQQLDFLGNFDDKFIQKMRKTADINEFSLDEKFELLNGLNKSGKSVFTEDFNKIFSVLPKDEKETDRFIKKVQTSITNERSLKSEEIKDKSLKNIVKTILADNKPDENQDKVKFYKNLSSQIMFEKSDISFKDRQFISSAVKSYGYIKDEKNVLSQQKAVLMLFDETTYEIMSDILKDEGVNIEQLDKNIKEFNSTQKILKQNTFSDINPEYIKEVCFSDGTINKVLDFNEIPDGNPNTFLHSTLSNIIDIVPVYQKDKKENLLDSIFSVSYSNSNNEINPFRKYGVTLYVEPKYILGGAEYDLATGYDKNIDNFTQTLFSDEFKDVRNFFKLKTQNLQEKDISDSIKATKRLDGRKYNEFLVLNPSITGVYVYGDNLEEIPYNYRKFAQDNDLFLIKLKTKGETNANN